jgi:hypothetical protein
MKLQFFAVIAFSVPLAAAQGSPATLSPGTTLPIQFVRSVDSDHVHAGDAVAARTTQQVRLANGQILPA